MEPVKTHRTNCHTLPPVYDDVSEDNGRGQETPTYYSTRRSAQKARQNIATALHSKDHDESHVQSGAIPLNTGNRFSTMADHTTKPAASNYYSYIYIFIDVPDMNNQKSDREIWLLRKRL